MNDQALVFNSNQVSPQRLFAVVRLVALTEQINRKDLLSLVQTGDRKQAAGQDTIRLAESIGLIQSNNNGTYVLNIPEDDVWDHQRFKRTLDRLLLGQTDENDPQFILNLFTAWYAAQNEVVLQESRDALVDRFNHEMFPGRQKQYMNSTKMIGWIRWAAYLGWGKTFKKSRMEQLIPDASERILRRFDQVLPVNSSSISISEFLSKLGACCPELDGGTLFKKCQDTRTDKNILSLMLSTSLQTLETTGYIRMILIDDTSDRRRIFGKLPEHYISHIERVSDD